MKGDFSRFTFRQDKHYSSVRLQQGRVQLDADWNEQIDIQAHHDRTAARDAVGPRGAPLDDAGFELSGGAGALQIGAGRYYVDGILCENEADVDFIAQPDLPRATLPAQAGNYLAYLDVWQRLVTAVEDPAIREVALGGPDTATRTQTVWQVKLQKLNSANDCAEFEEDWEPAGAASTGMLCAQARPQEEMSDDRCIVPPGAGYTRLENQLYRVEIHDGGEPYGAARSPGTATVIEDVDSPNRVQVAANDGQTWRVGQWVELFKQDSTTPGTLIRITSVDAQKLTLDVEDLDDRDLASIDPAPDRLRRVATFKFSRHNGAILARLERIMDDFVTVSDPGKDPTLGFAGGKRIELSDEERTLRGEPGVMVELKNVIGNDLEIVWPSAPMTMADFPTRSGGTPPTVRRWDSEGATPLSMETQWQDLEDGVQVGFGDGSYRSGDYWLIPARTLGGKVEWPQDSNGPTFEPPHGIEHHYCPLGLLELANNAWTRKTDCRRHFPPLTRLPADNIEYTPGGPCTALEGVTTVQEAIDELCKTGPGAEGIRILDVRTVDPNATLPNDDTVPVSALAGGLRVECDTPVDPNAVVGKPTCFVTLEMPYPLSDDEKSFWEIDKVVGYRPLILSGNVSAQEKSIRWAPAQDIEQWLRVTLFEKMARQGRNDSILVHLTLRGNFIWAQNDRSLFLDGEAVSVPRTAQKPVGLDLPSGDDRRGGDFGMWFWIKSELTSVRDVELPDPPIVTGGGIVQGTVRLHGEVTEDVAVRLSSSDPDTADFGNGQGEITVTVQAGTSEQSFHITTRPVLISKGVEIKAFSERSPDVVETAVLRVNQPTLADVIPQTNPTTAGSTVRGDVILNSVAPPGMEIDLRGEPRRLVSSLPSPVKVDEGSASTKFEITVSRDAVSGDVIEITASYRGSEVTGFLNIS
jgi:hypothetical protein